MAGATFAVALLTGDHMGHPYCEIKYTVCGMP
ncbi:hypothetical protein EZS27_023672 [termite gut metagenome]|uniref:Uncharacterized protein n=1 Tax=termite gut metagenome TaxID=433724 RepID=A0A5J4QZN1_9ZZZZ